MQTLSLRPLSCRKVEPEKCYFDRLLESFNPEQTENTDYEQYLQANERNNEAYGRSSLVEEEDSDTYVVYGQDAAQESFFSMRPTILIFFVH